MLGMLHLQGRNKPQETMARAARSSLLGLARSARPKEERKSPGFRAFRSATHLLIPAAAALAVAGFFLFSAPAAQAATGVVRRIIIQAATSDELDEIVLEPGELVYRVDDPKDVRIGNGLPGGARIWNFAALTNPPAVYDRDLDMDGHAIVLNSTYSLQASGGTVSIFAAGTNPVFQIVGQEGTSDGGFLRNATFGSTPTSIVVVVQHVDGDEDPVVEATASLVAPAWTAIDYELERLTPTTVRLTLPAPELGVFTYYRVTTTTLEASANFAVPLYVQGEPVLTAETDAAGLAAAADVQSNLTAHAEDAENPHGVTAEQIGALTEFTDLETDYGITLGTMAYEDADDYVLNVIGGDSAHAIIGADGQNFSGLLIWDNIEKNYLRLDYYDNDFYFGPTNTARIALWSIQYNTNVWQGRINDGEANRIASLPPVYPAGTTNFFIRPDGATNTITFDADNNMMIYARGVLAITVLSNGFVGIKGPGNAAAPLYVSGSIYGSAFADTGGNALDPSSTSTLLNLIARGNVTATQGVSQIILPTSTNGLVSGTLWNDGGTVKVMP